MFAVSYFEIIAYSIAILVWFNTVMRFIVPVVLFTVGNVRKKL